MVEHAPFHKVYKFTIVLETYVVRNYKADPFHNFFFSLLYVKFSPIKINHQSTLSIEIRHDKKYKKLTGK